MSPDRNEAAINTGTADGRWVKATRVGGWLLFATGMAMLAGGALWFNLVWPDNMARPPGRWRDISQLLGLTGVGPTIVGALLVFVADKFRVKR